MAVQFFELLQQYEQCLRVERNLSERTRRAYLYDLTRFQEFLVSLYGRTPSPGAIRPEALREYLNHLQLDRGYKSTSLARVIASLRMFFDFAVRRGVVDRSPAAQLHTPKQPKKLPVYLVPQELTRLLETPDPTSRTGLRDRAILHTLAFTGARLSEIVGIDVRDVDLHNRTVRILGKGSKERIVPLNELVLGAINDYLNVRPLSDDTALFLNRFGKRMTGRAVEYLVRKYVLKAGIFKMGISPHKLRHTFATLLHAHDVDLIEIKDLMGHASIASTQIYTHTSSARLRAAVQKLEKL